MFQGIEFGCHIYFDHYFFFFPEEKFETNSYQRVVSKKNGVLIHLCLLSKFYFICKRDSE